MLERLEASKKRMRELQDEVASATAAAMATEAPSKARKVSLIGLYSTGYSTACILSYFPFWKKISGLLVLALPQDPRNHPGHGSTQKNHPNSTKSHPNTQCTVAGTTVVQLSHTNGFYAYLPLGKYFYGFRSPQIPRGPRNSLDHPGVTETYHKTTKSHTMSVQYCMYRFLSYFPFGKLFSRLLLKHGFQIFRSTLSSRRPHVQQPSVAKAWGTRGCVANV